LRDDMVSACGAALPSALACLLERLFGEERRRTKVIPLAFGERVVLKSFLQGFEYGPRF
jgi:hypothetical protein